MDGDPAVDSELDTFSLILPLPYRIAFILVLGVWAWGVNLHYLYLLKIVKNSYSAVHGIQVLINYFAGCSHPH